MARSKKGNKIDGWINLDKPPGMTSTQAIGALRRLLRPAKIGHAGTLDPLATGILPVALGEATKTIPYAHDTLKTYQFAIVWGEQRNTDDAEGEVIATSDVRPSGESIEAALPAFTGTIWQTPPRFSAVKVEGRRAYDIARAGENVELAGREAYIERFELLEAGAEQARFSVVSGKGVYMRSLARDLAHTLNTKGYIRDLRRLQVGPFTEKNAISLDFLEKIEESARLEACLLPPETALDDIPALAVRQDEAASLRSGRELVFLSRHDTDRLSDIGAEPSPEFIYTGLATTIGKPVAIVEIDGATVRPVRVFNL
jgi:tRNA pseudouridine55 synthase